MKPALMANIEVSLPSKANELVSTITAKMIGKALWKGQESVVTIGESDNGNSIVTIELRFDKLEDRADMVKYLKSIDNRPNIKVTGLIHNCKHDESLPCESWEEI